MLYSLDSILSMASSSFGSFDIEEIFEFGKVCGFFLERRLDILNLFDRRGAFLNLLDPFLDMVVILIDFGLNVVQILDYQFALFGHYFDALEDG
jgi:hypothetical protein